MNSKLRLGKVGRVTAVIGMSGAAAATALVLTPGTFGGFTAGATNAGNTVSAGTVQMSDSVTGAISLTGHDYASNNLAPGHYASNTVMITNSGSLPADVNLSVANVSITGPNCMVNSVNTCAGDYTLTITDAEGTPVNVINGTLANSQSATAVKDSSGNTAWTAGGSDTFTVKVTLNSNAGNEAQGSTASFDLGWASTSV